jgi:CHAT domain-containing protein
MGDHKLSLTALITLILSVSQPIANLPPLFQASQVLAQTPVDRKAEADRLLNQGIEQYQTSQVEAALQSWQQALIIYREIKYRKGEGNALSNLGTAYNILGDYSKAIDYHSSSLAIAREIKDRKGEGQSLNNLGNAYYILGDYSKAIDYHSSSLAIAREIKDRKGEEQSLGNLGVAYNILGDYSKSIDYLLQTLAIAREIKDREGEGQSLGNLGNAYYGLGDYSKAIDYHSSSLAIAREIKYRLVEGQSLGSLGNAYYALGDYNKAIDYHSKRLVIAREIKDRKGEENALGDLGNAYYGLGDYSKAIDYYSSSLVIAREIKYRLGEGQSLGNLGLAYSGLGDYSKAIDYLLKTLAIAREIKDRKGEGQSLNNLGNAYSGMGDYNKAIDYYFSSLAIAREIKDRLEEGTALNNLGLAYRESGNLKEAEKPLRTGIEVWESLRRQLGKNDSYKVSIFEEQARTYRTLQEVLIAQNKTEEALEISERGRSRAFVELLTSRLSSKNIGQIPEKPTLLLLKQIAKQQNDTLVEYSIITDKFKVQGKQETHESELYIWVIKPTGEVTFRKTDLRPMWEQQNTSLRDKVVQTRQSIVKGVNVASRGNNITLTPGDRVKLNDDDPDWEAWQVISVDVKNGKITIRLPSWEASKPAIERPIADVAKKIGINSSGANAKNLQLQELYQLLIQPIADILPKEETARLIFIPQDALFLVPFPALQDPSGQYLIDKHTILTAPSIQVLESTHKLRQKVPGSAKDILVVGNPTMPKISKNPGESPKQLSALPGSEKEALAIASFWKTQALIGNQATKNAVLQKLPLAKIIHLATHGLLDDIRGLGSSIVFAPEGQDNGLLTAEDILNLYTAPQGSTLSAELVVLSACDTGQGRLTGDGVIGLSRSIIAAGVPSVIVSLWSIPDAPTAELMTEFYENFRKNPDKATALRQAMLTTKKKHPNPAEWAAFTLIGESE